MDIFDGASAKTKAQFNSGSVCVKLNTGAGLKEYDKPIFFEISLLKAVQQSTMILFWICSMKKYIWLTIQYGMGFEITGLDQQSFM